jgi:hypothetical protein
VDLPHERRQDPRQSPFSCRRWLTVCATHKPSLTAPRCFVCSVFSRAVLVHSDVRIDRVSTRRGLRCFLCLLAPLLGALSDRRLPCCVLAGSVLVAGVWQHVGIAWNGANVSALPLSQLSCLSRC